MTDRPMQPPARQPIGFWTARCGEAVRRRTRSALAEIGVSQPQWWVIHQLHLHPDGVEQSAVVATVGPNETPTAIEQAIADAIGASWVAVEDGVLRLTAAGGAIYERANAIQDELAEERRRGIDDDAYATTISVLQRTIENVGGDAWHW